MVDLILALVLLALAGAGAELVRATCRRQLMTPVRSDAGVSLRTVDVEPMFGEAPLAA